MGTRLAQANLSAHEATHRHYRDVYTGTLCAALLSALHLVVAAVVWAQTDSVRLAIYVALGVYAAVFVFTLAGQCRSALCDATPRYRTDWSQRTLSTMAVTQVLFVTWELSGVALGIYDPPIVALFTWMAFSAASAACLLAALPFLAWRTRSAEVALNRADLSDHLERAYAQRFSVRRAQGPGEV